MIGGWPCWSWGSSTVVSTWHDSHFPVANSPQMSLWRWQVSFTSNGKMAFEVLVLAHPFIRRACGSKAELYLLRCSGSASVSQQHRELSSHRGSFSDDSQSQFGVANTGIHQGDHVWGSGRFCPTTYWWNLPAVAHDQFIRLLEFCILSSFLRPQSFVRNCGIRPDSFSFGSCPQLKPVEISRGVFCISKKRRWREGKALNDG